jgi:hypothetical protein
MTTKADFTEEEWARLERAPIVAGMAISLADPGGPIELFKETKATLTVVGQEAQAGTHGELAGAVAKSIAEKAQKRENPVGDFKPKGTMAGEQVLDELRGVNTLLSEKASAEDADGYRQWLLQAAQNAANAAKEGGFMGFHAVRVSEGEQQMLDKLQQVLSAPAT